MAIVKYGNLISEARGKENGVVYSRNTYGAYMRNKVTPINPQTAKQVAQRQRMTTATQLWSTCTEAQVKGWGTLAGLVTNINIFGDNVPLTAFNLFVRVNINLQLIGAATITAPPAPTAPVSLTSIQWEAPEDVGDSVDFSPTPVPAGTALVIFATSPVKKNKTFVSSEYRFMKKIAAAAVSPADISAEYTAAFGTIPVGMKAFVKGFLISTTNGFPSAELATSEVKA